MFRLDADRPVEFCDGLRRRDFLHAGSLATLGLTLTDWFGLRALGAAGPPDVNCILLMLIGGPSQLDTFDMKPNAPVEIRGPYKPIRTNVPGIEISENFPRTARHADKFSLIRSVYCSPFRGVISNRPRPSCAVRNAATCLPEPSTTIPAISAGFCAGVRASR